MINQALTGEGSNEQRYVNTWRATSSTTPAFTFADAHAYAHAYANAHRYGASGTWRSIG